MPLYVYQCQDCGDELEMLQKFSDDPPTVCGCGGRLNRVIGDTSFILKGSGWYKDGYASKKTTKK